MALPSAHTQGISLPGSFPQFHLLPLELQLKIWSLCLPPPRVVDIIAIPINEILRQRLPPNSTCSSDPNAGTWVRTFTERVYSPMPAQPLALMLHVSHQTRKLALQHYSKIVGDIGDFAQRETRYKDPITISTDVELVFGCEVPVANRPFALLDPECDIQFLQDPASPGYQAPKISSLEILVRWLEPELVASMRRLALPYYSWRKTRVIGSLKVLLQFSALQEIWISFLGGYEPGRRNQTWTEVLDVGELGGHLGEAEMEVRSDVEDLKGESPGWGKEVKVGFVKHRGHLVDILES